jgi:transcriptional regulator with XRE-family HTH domain
MSSNIQCYLRTLRNEWGLTQEDLASLLPKGDRTRVGRVESGKVRPNAGEILAYGLIFGLPAGKIFRGLSEDTNEAVMQRAYRLSRRLEKDRSPKGQRKRELVERLRARAIKSTQQHGA